MRWIALMSARTIACSGRIQLPENGAVDGVEHPGTGWLPGTDGPGAQDDPGAQSGAGGSDGAAGASGASAMEPSTRCNGGLAAGPAPMRRLTQSEYNNTVRDLLGDTSALADDFVADGKVGLFENNAYSPMTTILATQYAEAAETLAASAAQNLDELLPCDPAATGEDACAREFIAAFGKRAYRRPLAQVEIDRLHGLYSQLRMSADYDFTGGVRVLIQAMLQNTRRGWLISIENWYAQQFKYLLDKLDAIPEGDGTMLDNTACVWIHEQSNGGSHDRNDMPFVLAGSCGGFFGTGRCIDFQGRPHNDLLVTLAHAMNVPLERFGDDNFTGPIDDLLA